MSPADVYKASTVFKFSAKAKAADEWPSSLPRRCSRDTKIVAVLLLLTCSQCLTTDIAAKKRSFEERFVIWVTFVDATRRTKAITFHPWRTCLSLVYLVIDLVKNVCKRTVRPSWVPGQVNGAAFKTLKSVVGKRLYSRTWRIVKRRWSLVCGSWKSV